MKIKELKEFLNNLPDSVNEYSVSNGEFGTIEGKENYYRLDKPIVCLYVDEDAMELCLLHQTEEEISEIQTINRDNKNQKSEETDE